uniref:CHK kinase-like domain-containing protein n=1 Tax=Panagrolaimus sp. JU765 TaxID=591449 RepID=A0AC34RFU2_9BILA
MISDSNFSIDFVLEKLSNFYSDCCLDLLEDFHAEDITHGSAFFSRIFRVEFCWKNSKTWPKSIILKVPGIQQVGKFQNDEEDEMLDYLEYCHSNEIRIYEFLHDESKKQGITLKIPKVYYGSDFSRHHNNGLIIMDDLSKIGGTLRLLPGLNNAQIESVIQELAKIHVLTWKNGSFIKNHIGKPQMGNFVVEMTEMAQKLRELDPKIFNPLIDEIQKIFTPKTAELSYYTDSKFGFPATLIHSDLWSANIIFSKNENVITDDLLAIIDWQCAEGGNPGVDIGRLLAINTSSSYRRKNTKRLLKLYFTAVNEEMNGQELFTFEQLEAAYDASMGYAAMYMGFGVPHYYHMPAVVGSKNQESQQIELLDRTKCFFEDTIEAFKIRKFDH